MLRIIYKRVGGLDVHKKTVVAAQRGKKRAIVAIAHSMLVSAWHTLIYPQPYRELGGDYFDQRKKESKVNYLVRRLELTGGSISIEFQAAAA